MTEHEAMPYPLDFDSLEKGTVIPADAVAAAIETSRDDRLFSLRAMRLAESIKTALAERGLNVVVCSEKDSLRILTDEEAVEYTGRGFRDGLRSAARRHADASRIDTANLSADAAKKLDRQLVLQAAQLSAARSALRSELQRHDEETKQIQ